jgi:hypothetical protein
MQSFTPHPHPPPQVGDEAVKFYSSLSPSLVHVAPDVATAVAHIKAVLAK